ncbi:MAG: hypothetical protein BAJALOKI2v1_90042 [Promethearchaeota archaeon]|nr:MAG: hypothetical protein BAJALOKI2v1_90042 [Candidatus Lokiarchaeota archaeon]
MGLQVFRIENDGTTTELSTDGPIKDILETDQSYVIVSDEQRKVYLWKGITSSVRSKFIGAKRSQEIRGQVGMHYSVVPLDEGEEEQEFLDIIGGKTEAGIAQEIKAEDLGGKASGGHPLREKSEFDAPEPAGGMNIAGSKQRQSQNSGPLYTGTESMAPLTQDTQQINFEKIMQKLEEIKMPEGFERELIIIGNHAYSVVEKTQTFLGEKQVEKVIEKVGSIPEGVFFAENYSPRILSEGGRIIAIEFLRHKGNGNTKRQAAGKGTDKKQLLKDQIKSQLEKK